MSFEGKLYQLLKMNDEVQKRIEANRRKALEKLRKLRESQGSEAAPVLAKPKIVLTPEQKAQIEKNKLRALEKQRVAKQNLRDASGNQLNLRNPDAFKNDKALDRIRPAVRKADYIDYDFATMRDSYGGFISDDPNLKSKEEISLEQWKEEQKSKLVVDPPPPQDTANLPKCFECGSIDLDQQLLTVFDCRVCKKCKEQNPEKYSLLTKTECREDYFLTDPELKDVSLLKRLEKPNPYSGTYSRMQLFLRYQVEEFAFKKWGGEEGLDKEWQRREEMRVNRREKKFTNKLKEMRKRTRAEEYTRKLRAKSDSHVHEWSAPVQKADAEQGMVSKRCIGCGMEVEQFII